jgi:hypothetical protein
MSFKSTLAVHGRQIESVKILTMVILYFLEEMVLSSRNFPLTEPDVSPPSSQERAIGLCSDPVHFSPRRSTL